MSSTRHISIGDVLNELRDEFPDITVSKIRFLESQGLIEPERTPSGYRKFSSDDVDRLRFILREQREHFLPLRVIKERLDEIDATGGPLLTGGPHVVSPTTDDAPGEAPEPASPNGAAPSAPTSDAAQPSGDPVGALFERARREAAVIEAERAAAQLDQDLSDDGTDDDDPLASGATGASLTRGELAHAAELTEPEITELESFGLLAPVVATRDHVLFDEEALVVARACAVLMRHGIEPRHLRMYRQHADREAALFEQVVMGLRRQRNPEAKEQVDATLRELAGQGRKLRNALLRRAVRDAVSGPVPPR